jgi:Sulfotransferase domain
MVDSLSRQAEYVPAQEASYGFVPKWTYDFSEACGAWRRHVKAAVDFASQHPDRCIAIRHDRLSEDPQEALGRVFQFLGLDPEDGPVEYCLNHRPNSSFSHVGAARAKRGVPWTEWTAEQKRIFLWKAGPTQYDLGFMTAAELAEIEDEAMPAADDNTSYWRPLAIQQEVVARVKQIVQNVVPSGAKILVVSKGDEEIIRLTPRDAEHFPQDSSGGYAGHYPGDSAEAIAHLEELRAAGARYLVFPQTSLWWLEQYADFGRHLDDSYERLWNDETCVVFRLDRPE